MPGQRIAGEMDRWLVDVFGRETGRLSLTPADGRMAPQYSTRRHYRHLLPPIHAVTLAIILWTMAGLGTGISSGALSMPPECDGQEPGRCGLGRTYGTGPAGSAKNRCWRLGMSPGTWTVSSSRQASCERFVPTGGRVAPTSEKSIVCGGRIWYKKESRL